jgi:hypothetical protein
LKRLVWSLGNSLGDEKKPHSQYIYDMFYLSIQAAKDLGYHTVFYGTHESVNIIGKWVHEVHDVTNKIPYKLYDDIKVWIWYNESNCTTIDADVFLYKKLVFKSPQDLIDGTSLSDSTNLSRLAWNDGYSSRLNPVTLRYEEFDKMPPSHQVRQALKEFNLLNPKSVIPEWDYNNTSSFNTGIVSWNSLEKDFKNYYCESYSRLRNWYLNKVGDLKGNPSVVSHFICEHLLYQLVKYYGKSGDSLKNNVDNHYVHLKGGNKFKNQNLIYSIKTLVDFHKKTGGFIENSHNALVNRGTIKPFLYIRDRYF